MLSASAPDDVRCPTYSTALAVQLQVGAGCSRVDSRDKVEVGPI